MVFSYPGISKICFALSKKIHTYLFYTHCPISSTFLSQSKKTPTSDAIPTTAGTGSETTLACVIVDSETRHKYVINDFPLIPRYAVLDPKVTLSLPPFITATTGMDALTHAVEAYIGNSTTVATKKESLMAVSLIFQNLETAYEDGSNIEARRNMLKASYYAGCAFTKSYVGYVHAVAHSLGGAYNVPHGLANAILLPFVLEAYGESIHKKLAHYADKEANPLYPVPVLMDAAELETFYYLLLEDHEQNDH